MHSGGPSLLRKDGLAVPHHLNECSLVSLSNVLHNLVEFSQDLECNLIPNPKCHQAVGVKFLLQKSSKSREVSEREFKFVLRLMS